MSRTELRSGIYSSGDTAPEKKEDAFTHGIAYIHLKPFIQRMGPFFTAQVYIPKRGIVTVTNENTPQGGLAILLDERNRKEPGESDMIYFDQKTVDKLVDYGFDTRRFELRTAKRIEQEEAPSYRPIDPAIKKRVMETSQDAADITGVHKIVKTTDIPPPAASGVGHIKPDGEEPEEAKQAG